jgi:hypothetical protein
MKGKGDTKIHIVTRTAGNTAFKNKIGQALKSIS